MKQNNNTPVKRDASNNDSILEAYRLFNSTLGLDVSIRKNCEEYIKQILLDAPKNELAMLGDKGECVSVTYDGDNHLEYYSVVNTVFLDDEKNICLSTEDCDDYPMKNIDTEEVYEVATFIYEVLNHNEHPETSDEPENASDEKNAPIWILFYEIVIEYELNKRQIKVYHDYDKALKEFRTIVETEQKKASDEEWSTDFTVDKSFESFENGYFARTHVVVELSESAVTDRLE